MRHFPIFLLAFALSAQAAGSKDTHVVKPGQILGTSERTVEETLQLPGDITRTTPEVQDESATRLDPQDFSEVLALQEQLSANASEAQQSSSNPEIAGTQRLRDALRASGPSGDPALRAAALPRRPGDVNFDGYGARASGELSLPPAHGHEMPGFYDVIGQLRRAGASKQYTVAKGVKVDERTIEAEGHRLLVQDIEGWWPQEFFMTRVFFFRKDASGKMLVAVKTDGDGLLTDGRAEDFQAELQWWRDHWKTSAPERGK